MCVQSSTNNCWQQVCDAFATKTTRTKNNIIQSRLQYISNKLLTIETCSNYYPIIRKKTTLTLHLMMNGLKIVGHTFEQTNHHFKLVIVCVCVFQVNV